MTPPTERSIQGRVLAWLAGVRPRRADLGADAVAGIPGAISSVPDGMATAVLAGVNPAYGLYASFAGKIGGGLTHQHQADGRHHHHRRVAGRRLRARRPVAGGQGPFDRAAHPAHRGRDHRPRRAAAGPLRPVRLPLGDARLPHRRRGQHPARAAAGPDRVRRPRRRRRAEGVVRHHPPGRHRLAGRGDRRRGAADPDVPAEPYPLLAVRLAGRRRRADRRWSRGSGSDVDRHGRRRRATIPSGMPPLVLPQLSDLTVGRGHRRAVHRGDRAGPGRRGGRGRPEPGRQPRPRRTATSSARVSRTWPPGSSTARRSAARSAPRR